MKKNTKTTIKIAKKWLKNHWDEVVVVSAIIIGVYLLLKSQGIL